MLVHQRGMLRWKSQSPSSTAPSPDEALTSSQAPQRTRHTCETARHGEIHQEKWVAEAMAKSTKMGEQYGTIIFFQCRKTLSKWGTIRDQQMGSRAQRSGIPWHSKPKPWRTQASVPYPALPKEAAGFLVSHRIHVWYIW